MFFHATRGLVGHGYIVTNAYTFIIFEIWRNIVLSYIVHPHYPYM